MHSFAWCRANVAWRAAQAWLVVARSAETCDGHGNFTRRRPANAASWTAPTESPVRRSGTTVLISTGVLAEPSLAYALRHPPGLPRRLRTPGHPASLEPRPGRQRAARRRWRRRRHARPEDHDVPGRQPARA